MKETGSNICPQCGYRFPAHKNNTKTFKQLTTKERDRSIRMMTLNLKRAINADVEATRARRLFWAIEFLAKRSRR